MRKNLIGLFVLLLAVILVACGGESTPAATANSSVNNANESDEPVAEAPVATDDSENAGTNNTDDPTEEAEAEVDSEETAEPEGEESGDDDSSEVDMSDDSAATENASSDNAADTSDDATEEPDATATAESDDTAPAGDAVRGEELYNSATLGVSGAALGCTVCHSVAEGVVVVGPSHFGIGAGAASRVPGMTAEEYLRESIVDPNAFVVDGFAADIMYQKYLEELTPEDIADLVAYLLSLQ